jgi:hypothetical protein
LLFNLEFYEEALPYFNLSIKIYGYKADTLYNIALLLTTINEPEAADEVITQILHHYPGHTLTLQQVAAIK